MNARAKLDKVPENLVAADFVKSFLSLEVKVGSKKFTESVILGELVARLTESTGAHAIHEKELGGTQVLWKALLRGDIDVYPEYTGTISHEILSGRELSGEAEIRDALESEGIRMSRPLGFNNTYAIGMKEEVAAKYNATKISDLRRHPDLQSLVLQVNSWTERTVGRPCALLYNLPHRDVARAGPRSGVPRTGERLNPRDRPIFDGCRDSVL